MTQAIYQKPYVLFLKKYMLKCVKTSIAVILLFLGNNIQNARTCIITKTVKSDFTSNIWSSQLYTM